MLPRRDAVLALLAGRSIPFRAKELASKLRVSESEYPGFVRFLESLAQEGALFARGELYGLGEPVRETLERGNNKEREGSLYADARGFGFVHAQGFDDDLYIPDHAMGGALHGDTVIARFVRKNAVGSEGEIVRVVKRGRQRVAGVLRKKGKSSWLEPDDLRMRGPIVLPVSTTGADGDAAVVAITKYPMLPDENPEGEMIKVLGEPGEPDTEVEKILIREAIEEAHPQSAVTEAVAYGTQVPMEALDGREDLTQIPLPTIDPEDARDHDDAVWVERSEDGTFQAWIAIADVSYYVRPNAALDDASKSRGCSIYLPDRAIPMLPAALSSNLCSLLPNELRLCVCIIVKLDAEANVLSTRIVRGYMKSVAKLTYPGVARALGFTDKPKVQPAAEEMVASLKVADSLSQMLRAKRLKRGALDFQLPQPHVVVHPETRAPVTVERHADDDGVKRAYQLIEELMLLGNEVVARYLSDRGIPTVYRVHAPPDEKKLERFMFLCEQVGAAVDPADVSDPKRLSQLLRRLSKFPKADVLNNLLLRSMKQAFYDSNNIGHFGLASPAYVHFTSPIRRYPDLVVHRILNAFIEKREVPKGPEAEEQIQQSAQQSSELERKTMKVEREIVDLYRAILMKSHIGETFEGTVTGLVSSGIFVALDSPYVDVMVRTEALGKDHYELDEENLRYVAKRSGDAVSLGDRVVVTIEDVALLTRTVYGWRHAPGFSDGGPLRQNIFKKPAKGKKAEPPQAPKSKKTRIQSSDRPTKTKHPKAGRKKSSMHRTKR